MVAKGSNARQLALAKLQGSGLDEADAKQLGMKFLDAPSLLKLFPKAPPGACGLQLVYHDLQGNPRTDTQRVRLLGELKGAFGEPLKLRYLQLPNTPPGAYFPMTTNWETIAANPTIPIVITEGELKAACAVKQGICCIGLGGVSSWQSRKRGWQLLPELEAIVWRERDVTICFDSDAATNVDIAHATAGLAKVLTIKGARVKVAIMPALADGSKTGIDDLVVARGPEALAEVLAAAEGDELGRKLWDFNSRFCYVLEPGFIVTEETTAKHNATLFTSSYGNEWATETTTGVDGIPRLKQTQVAKAWLEWPCRRTVERTTYAPGEERWVDGALNTWQGFAVEPVQGDLKPWTQLLDQLLVGASPVERWWFEAWCLYPLRHPGAKLPTAAGLWSRGQGLGKSLIGKLLGRIYGVNYSEVSQQELESSFNGWLVGKQLVMFDDVSAYDSRAKASVLKKLITQEEVTVNIKGIPTYPLPDHANFYLTSNQANAFYLEDRDRRFFVHEVTTDKLNKKFFAQFYAWMGKTKEHRKLGPGPAALLYHAQETADLSGFEPYEPPPTTTAKREMTDAAKSELELWLTELARDPDSKLRLGQLELQRDLFSARELLGIFDAERKGPAVIANALTLKARDHFPAACGGAPIRIEGVSDRLFIVRNPGTWEKASEAAIVKHLTAGRAIEQGGKKTKY